MTYKNTDSESDFIKLKIGIKYYLKITPLFLRIVPPSVKDL